MNIDINNDVHVVLSIICHIAKDANFMVGIKNAKWFRAIDLFKYPYGYLLKDDYTDTINANACRILERAAVAGIISDIGPKKAHGGRKDPSIYLLNAPFWEKYLPFMLSQCPAGTMDTPEWDNMLFTLVWDWYKCSASQKTRLCPYEYRKIRVQQDHL